MPGSSSDQGRQVFSLNIIGLNPIPGTMIKR
jgi:hypothetical protein